MFCMLVMVMFVKKRIEKEARGEKEGEAGFLLGFLRLGMLVALMSKVLRPFPFSPFRMGFCFLKRNRKKKKIPWPWSPMHRDPKPKVGMEYDWLLFLFFSFFFWCSLHQHATLVCTHALLLLLLLAGVNDLVRKGEQELCETSLGSGVIAEDTAKGCIT